MGGATQTAELTASDGATNEGLGNAVGISGDTVVASAFGHKVGDHAQQGAAYVFVKPAAGWANATQTAELTASDGVARDSLSAVSVSDDTIVAGATMHQVGANARQGGGYVFVEPATGWVNATQTAELTASDGLAGDQLGLTVAISGDTAVLGAPFHQVGLKQEGAAYVFVKTILGWSAKQTQNAELTPSDGATNDRFGASVGVSGNSVVVGALAHQPRRVVPASYTCAAPAGATITACAGPVINGAPIDTAALGPHSFRVSSTESDGITATQTVTYTVASATPTGTGLTPTISDLRQSASVWREGRKLPRTAPAHRRPVGTTFSLSLNEPASVTLTFTRRTPGRKVGGRCIARALSQRHSVRCTRLTVAGTIRLTARQGTTRIRFAGQLSHTKKLIPGSYTVKFAATDAAGR